MSIVEGLKFETILQKGNRFQVPRRLRWEFKLEPTQFLKVWLDLPLGSESFYTHMNKDGRITLPKLLLRILKAKGFELDEDGGLVGKVIGVTIQLAPAGFNVGSEAESSAGSDDAEDDDE